MKYLCFFSLARVNVKCIFACELRFSIVTSVVLSSFMVMICRCSRHAFGVGFSEALLAIFFVAGYLGPAGA